MKAMRTSCPPLKRSCPGWLVLLRPWDRFPSSRNWTTRISWSRWPVLYAAFDPEDLEDAEELLPLIEALEPPKTLTEAAEDLVCSVLLLADVSRPRRHAVPARKVPRNGAQRPQPPRGKPQRR